jgi:SPP1 family predicted phage head-tail adaptor
MRAGRLNRLVTIERREQIGWIGINEPEYGWVPVAKFWAERFGETETELNATNQVVAKTTAKFRTHYVAGITTVDRLICEGTTFDILGVIELGYRKGTEITAQQVE